MASYNSTLVLEPTNHPSGFDLAAAGKVVLTSLNPILSCSRVTSRKPDGKRMGSRASRDTIRIAYGYMEPLQMRVQQADVMDVGGNAMQE